MERCQSGWMRKLDGPYGRTILFQRERESKLADLFAQLWTEGRLPRYGPLHREHRKSPPANGSCGSYAEAFASDLANVGILSVFCRVGCCREHPDGQAWIEVEGEAIYDGYFCDDDDGGFVPVVERAEEYRRDKADVLEIRRLGDKRSTPAW